MIHLRGDSGFTAVELLITLFVAAAFLVAGYQLFNVVIQDGGETRAEARAANVAYDYMRRYSEAATNPCATATPLSNSSITVDSLTDVTLTVALSCPQADAPSLSRIDVTITYNSPQKTTTYTTYIDKSSGASPTVEVLDGLVAWWKLNGNANSDVGTANGTASNVVPTTGQNGDPNGAYSFNGSNSYIQIPAGFGDFTNGISISVWARPSSTTNYARFIDFGNGGPSNNFILTRNASTADILYATYNTTTSQGSLLVSGALTNSTWNHYVISHAVGGTVILYKNGVQIGTATVPLPVNVTRSSNYIGRSNWPADTNYAGLMDDIRIYNRAISGSEALQLYNGGAK